MLYLDQELRDEAGQAVHETPAYTNEEHLSISLILFYQGESSLLSHTQLITASVEAHRSCQ